MMLNGLTETAARALGIVALSVAVIGGAATVPARAEIPGPKSVAPIAKKLLDAVVNISTAQKVESRRRGALPSVPKGSPFEDLFEDFFENDDGDAARKVSSLGSGFVVDGTEGLIVTNNHVIDGADEITIIFKDGSKLRVDKVLGVDSKTDLALLKVSPETPLPDVKFGSSSVVEVGDWVLAIGNPFGLGGSVSVGIISAKERDIRTGPYDDYLQTDAAINKGNSGGPLFNMNGEVIGVNTAIISPTGGSIGIGFAVPADTARIVIDQLRRYGETRRGWLGVNIQTVTEDLAKTVGVSANEGALVSTVAENGPAKKAGIEPGDVIVSFDGRKIEKMRLLPRLVAQTEEGKTVDVEIVRDGERMKRTIVVGRLQEDADRKKKAAEDKKSSSANPEAAPKKTIDGPILGMTVEPLSDALMKKYGHRDSAKGVVVVGVEADGQAARKGLAEGDVIAEVSGTLVTDAAGLAAQIEQARKLKRRSILLRVVKADGSFRFVAMSVVQ
jgi:serine protease Do